MGRVFFAEKQILFWINWLITGGYGFSVTCTETRFLSQVYLVLYYMVGYESFYVEFIRRLLL